MNLDSSDYSASYLHEASKMRKSNNTINLAIICITVIIILCLIKDNLCSVEYQHGSQFLSVFLSCHQ
ncbi:Hok/Gef family protein [Photobacterium damselae]|uniref:Hok/Gef family protein n=1 Tax=Photobacterium damselae TaxID=38293 RepID=UPI004068CCAF